MGPLIVKTARSFIGVPFVHQGRSEFGIDCIGLAAVIADALGIEYEDDTTYTRTSPKKYTIEEKFSTYLTKVEKPFQLGDFVSFWIRKSKYPQHVGIISKLDPLSMVHTHAGVKRVVEHPLNDWWLKRVSGVWRYEG